MSTQWLYRFGGGTAEGRVDQKPLLGGKGANLAEMASLGIPVPPGFTITTEVCTRVAAGQGYPPELRAAVDEALAWVATHTGARFGDAADPMLLSVRSGAPASMPGMMDTILNLGLNDETVVGLATTSNSPRFAWDCYRRFVAMYGDVVMGVTAADEEQLSPFERLLDDRKHARRVDKDTDLDEADLRHLVAAYKEEILRHAGRPFPDDPMEQLWGAIGAVFRSWDTPRAQVYRRMQSIPASWGTAVNVQAMVFGNLGDDCATGVAFTRDPATGNKALYGEFLINAQGEDVVAGVRTPGPSIAWRRASRPRTRRWSTCAPGSRPTTRTCRTSSSRSSAAPCGCCRPAPASAPAAPWSSARSTWSTRASSTRTPRSCGSSRPSSTSCCTRRSIRPTGRRRSPRACRPRPAPRSAGSSSRRPWPRSGTPRARP